jgi:hypothetical protein
MYGHDNNIVWGSSKPERKIISYETENLVITSPMKSYVTVATWGPLALNGWIEELETQFGEARSKWNCVTHFTNQW